MNANYRALFTIVAFSLAACSSSTSGGEGGQGGGGQGGGTSCEGEGFQCSNQPLDCIGGSFYTDENGCLACDYYDCPQVACPTGSFYQCTGDGTASCSGVEGCGDIDVSDPELPSCSGPYACVDAQWTCECPTEPPLDGAACDDVGQRCDVPSDLDCGPATVTVECSADGWSRQEQGAGGGGGSGGGCG
jgi:hypothetical protein